MESQDKVNSDEEAASIEDILEGSVDVNDDGKLVKQKVKQADYTQREMVVVWHFLENRYQELYGTGRGSNVAYEHTAIWQEFAKAVDQIEEGKNERTVKKVWKRLDNMKYRGNDLFLCSHYVHCIPS